MKKLLLFFIPLIVLGVLFFQFKSLEYDPTRGETTLLEELEPELGGAVACIKVGTPDEDPLISNLQQMGLEIDYNGKSDTWFVDGLSVGSSKNEDEPWTLCMERNETMEKILRERDFIVAAGGFGG